MQEGYQTIVDKISKLANNNEARVHVKRDYCAKKLGIPEDESKQKAFLIEQKIAALKYARQQKDLNFFLRPYEHLTGS